MFCVLRNLQRSSPPRTIDLESTREFPPYFKRSAEMGGAKTRRLTFAKARWLKESALVHNSRRVLGGPSLQVEHPTYFETGLTFALSRAVSFRAVRALRSMMSTRRFQPLVSAMTTST